VSGSILFGSFIGALRTLEKTLAIFVYFDDDMNIKPVIFLWQLILHFSFFSPSFPHLNSFPFFVSSSTPSEIILIEK
jgi:hypothetical protein